jgi:hypothetical protein
MVRILKTLMMVVVMVTGSSAFAAGNVLPLCSTVEKTTLGSKVVESTQESYALMVNADFLVEDCQHLNGNRELILVQPRMIELEGSLPEGGFAPGHVQAFDGSGELVFEKKQAFLFSQLRISAQAEVLKITIGGDDPVHFEMTL